MEESKLITLLDHVYERLSNIEINVSDRISKIENDIVDIRRSQYSAEVSAALSNQTFFEVNLYNKFFKIAHIPSKYDYFYVLGDLYDTFRGDHKFDVKRMMALFWYRRLSDDNWNQIDKLFVEGYNLNPLNKKIKSCSDLIEIDSMIINKMYQFPNNKHKASFKKYFGIK